jgi:hypothetical protein
MSSYFCTGCGEPQPEIGQFCTNCGEPIDAKAVSQATAARPHATIRLPQGGPAGPTPSTVAVVGTRLPPTTAVPAPGPMPASRSARPLFGRLKGRAVAIGGAALVLLLIAGALLTRVLPLGNSEVDRVVLLTQTRNGDTIMALMRSDGSRKVTLVDEPGANAMSQSFFVEHLLSENENDRITGYNMPGAAVLTRQGRIVFWYPSFEGVEIRSVSLDGDDEIKLVQGSQVKHVILPATGNQLLLVEGDNTSNRLVLIDLRGQVTTIAQDSPGVDGTLSPDGKHIAYWERDETGSYKLSVADNTGANITEVARGLQSVSAHFSADSSKLFINQSDTDGPSFHVADANGQGVLPLSRAGSGQGDVAQGRLIFQVDNAGEASLFTSDLNGEDRVEIVRGADDLSWGLTRDRRQVIYRQVREGRFSLQVSDFNHEQTQELKRSDDFLWWLNLDDGRVLVLREGTVSTIKLDGSDEQVLMRGIDSASIDSQGGDIVVAGQEQGNGALYLLGGDEPIQLNDEADGYGPARIMPDGRIIYTAQFNSGPVTYIVDRRGQQKKLLAEDSYVLATGF